MPVVVSRVASSAKPAGLRDGTEGAEAELATRKPTMPQSMHAGSGESGRIDAAREIELSKKLPPRRRRRSESMMVSFHSETFPP
jgi:hypothetical protein